MGWSFAIDDSRAEGDQGIGYSVPAKCDLDGCEVDIDRGLAYVCGSDPYGGEHGCGKFFCADHLAWYSYWTQDGQEHLSPQMCDACGAEWEKRGLTEDEYYELQNTLYAQCRQFREACIKFVWMIAEKLRPSKRCRNCKRGRIVNRRGRFKTFVVCPIYGNMAMAASCPEHYQPKWYVMKKRKQMDVYERAFWFTVKVLLCVCGVFLLMLYLGLKFTT